jgi:hypothetical protein
MCTFCVSDHYRGLSSHLGTIDCRPVCINNTCFCAYLYSRVRRVHGAVHGIVPLPPRTHVLGQEMHRAARYGLDGALPTDWVRASVKSIAEPFLMRGDNAPGGSTDLRCRKLGGRGKFCLCEPGCHIYRTIASRICQPVTFSK